MEITEILATLASAAGLLGSAILGETTKRAVSSAYDKLKDVLQAKTGKKLDTATTEEVRSAIETAHLEQDPEVVTATRHLEDAIQAANQALVSTVTIGRDQKGVVINTGTVNQTIS